MTTHPLLIQIRSVAAILGRITSVGASLILRLTPFLTRSKKIRQKTTTVLDTPPQRMQSGVMLPPSSPHAERISSEHVAALPRMVARLWLCKDGHTVAVLEREQRVLVRRVECAATLRPARRA